MWSVLRHIFIFLSFENSQIGFWSCLPLCTNAFIYCEKSICLCMSEKNARSSTNNTLILYWLIDNVFDQSPTYLALNVQTDFSLYIDERLQKFSSGWWFWSIFCIKFEGLRKLYQFKWVMNIEFGVRIEEHQWIFILNLLTLLTIFEPRSNLKVALTWSAYFLKAEGLFLVLWAKNRKILLRINMEQLYFISIWNNFIFLHL
jgi:hypothetical protein